MKKVDNWESFFCYWKFVLFPAREDFSERKREKDFPSVNSRGVGKTWRDSKLIKDYWSAFDCFQLHIMLQFSIRIDDYQL